MNGLYMPVYTYLENKFIILGNPCYETHEEAIKRGVADGFALMAKQDVGVVSGESFRIPFSEAEGVWMVNCSFPGHEVAVFEGPVWDEELGDED